jgi:molybdopterin molybdotransferase
MFNHNDIVKDSVKLKGFSKYTSVDNAWQIFSKGADIQTLDSTPVTLFKARGRALAEDVKAEINLPPFDRAAVDGYAVRSQDTQGASLTNPIVLDLVGVVEIGQRGSSNVGEMETVRISTGAPTPTGADSVVMLEYTEEIDKTHVEIKRSTTPNQNLIRTGEDIRAGEIFLRKGTLIKPQDIALLAALGKKRVKVVRKPRVAVLSTGDELVEVGKMLHRGKCFDSNRYFILTAVEEFGGEPLDLGITPDRLKMLKSRLVKATRIADLIVVSGATSVGGKDLVPDAVASIGKSAILIHGVAIRPGRPVALGKIVGKPIILLPGFPVAAMVNFYLFAQKAICKMLGVSYSPFGGWKITAKIGRRVASEAGIRDFVRVHVKHSKEGYIAEPIRVRGSGVISSMVKANGILIIPEGKEGFEEGEHAEVIIMRNLGAETYDT